MNSKKIYKTLSLKIGIIKDKLMVCLGNESFFVQSREKFRVPKPILSRPHQLLIDTRVCRFQLYIRTVDILFE